MTSIFKKALPAVAGLVLLAGSPAFAASHEARTMLSAHSYVSSTTMRSDVCGMPVVTDKYAQSTATPMGCPGDSGPYN